MKQLMSSTRVLVASDNTDDAQLIQRQLNTNFSHVQVSTNLDRCVQDFERHAPEVLVLAFDRLEKAQSYYLGLYRLGAGLLLHPHGTVMLCSKEEVHTVFDLCKQAYFDDYVLYWPHSHDGSRLAMSIWNVGRWMTASRAGAPHSPRLLDHPCQAGEPNRLNGQENDNAGAHTAARRGAAVVEGSSVQLKGVMASALAGTRPLLLDQGRRVRRNVMVIDDDEFARMLVDQVLDPLVWKTTFAVNGATALAHLDLHRPDVILMDIHLPGLDGVALTHRLKASPPLAGIPIIMMTGDANKAALSRSMEAGAASFVVKPFTRESLTSKLEGALSPSTQPVG